MEEFDKLSDKEKENTFVFRSGSVIVVAPTEEAMKIAK